MNKIAFKVKKQAEKSILQGHPWVYESSIIKQSTEGTAGDIAVIFDQRRNKLLALGLFDPNSVIRIRVLHNEGKVTIDRNFFKEKVKLAYKKRSDLLLTDTTAFRLIYGENDGLSGLIIDIYNNTAVIKLYSEVWLPYLGYFKEIISELLSLETIVLRLNRLLQKSNLAQSEGDVIYGELINEEVIFKEHGLLFKANMLKGHKTGYFLDHRHNRLKVRRLSKSKKVLDIFSYAGGFSVNALAGGATAVVSLDISGQALEMAKSNVALNFETTNHETMAIDAFKGIEKLRRQREKFGVLIVDPPSFAKSEDQIKGAIKSYRRLVSVVLPLIDKNGILLMCSCSSRIERDVFYELVIEEIAKSNRSYVVLEKTSHDIDHPEGIKELSYLKSIYIKIE